MEIVDHWGDKKEAVIAAPVEGMRNLTTDHKAIPEGYSQVMKKQVHSITLHQRCNQVSAR